MRQAALRERGFRTTQATISRDVAELGLIKVTREGTAAYALPPRLIEAETSGEDRLRKLLSDLPLRVAFSVLRVARDDPAERILIDLLLHSEDDLIERNERSRLPAIPATTETLF